MQANPSITRILFSIHSSGFDAGQAMGTLHFYLTHECRVSPSTPRALIPEH